VEIGDGANDGKRLRGEKWWASSLLEGGECPCSYDFKIVYYADITKADDFVWRFARFYGEPSLDKKTLSWKVLLTLNAARRHPWLCVGDFNEILSGCEKEGGPDRPQPCMDRFKEALEECGLSDLGFVGDPFT
jgi:hypothetical protein